MGTSPCYSTLVADPEVRHGDASVIAVQSQTLLVTVCVVDNHDRVVAREQPTSLNRNPATVIAVENR
jgi:hypothetical protein